MQYLDAFVATNFGLYTNEELPLSWRWMKSGIDTIRNLFPCDLITDFAFSNHFITQLCKDVYYTHNQAIQHLLDNMGFPPPYAHQECFDKYKSGFKGQFLTPNVEPKKKCRCSHYDKNDPIICTPIMIIDFIREITEEELYDFVFWCTELRMPGAKPIIWELMEIKMDLRKSENGMLNWSKPRVYTCSGIVKYTNAIFYTKNPELIQKYKDYIRESMQHKNIDLV